MLKATEDGKNPRYRGIAMVLKAYSVWATTWICSAICRTPKPGKATRLTPNKSPKFDKDADIYEDLLKLCDQAVVELAKPQPVAVINDYMGSR